MMSLGAASLTSHLVQVRAEPEGLFTAELLGLSEVSSTAPTREAAIDQLRTLIQQRLDSGILVTIDIPQENPLMNRFGWAQNDPTFDDYLSEIRKFREEVDRRENAGSGSGECSDTSSTPIT